MNKGRWIEVVDDSDDFTDACVIVHPDDWRDWCALRDEWRNNPDGRDNFADLTVVVNYPNGHEDIVEVGARFDVWREA